MAANQGKRVGRVLWRLGGVALLGAIVLYTGLYLFLATPFAAARLSRLLSDYLHESAVIGGLGLSGSGVRLTGLTVANPAGYAPGAMLSVSSLTVRPRWLALISGEKRFRTLEVAGLRLNLEKNRAGEWNFARLKHLTAGRKPATETFIRLLRVRDAALRVDGHALEGLNLTVHDLATRGTATGGLSLDARDNGGNPYHLEGTARLGDSPTANLTLRTPALRLGVFAPLLKPGSPLLLDDGRGQVDISAALAAGELTLRAAAAVERLRVRLAGELLPVRGTLGLTARYSFNQDEAQLDEVHLAVNDSLRLRGSGLLRGVKGGDRRFQAFLSFAPLKVVELFRLLPERLRRDLSVTGELSAAELRLAGDAAGGVTAGTGSVGLTGVTVRRGETIICTGARAGLSLQRLAGGWQIAGSLERPPGGPGLVEALSLPLRLRLSPRLRPVSAEVPAMDLRLAGARLTGKARYTRGAAVPWEARLVLPETPVALLQRFLPAEKVGLTGGTVAAEVVASGATPRGLAGRGTMRLARLAGTVGSKPVALARGTIGASFSPAASGRELRGTVDLGGGSYGGKPFAVACSYGLRGVEYRLQDGTLSFGGSTLRFAALSGTVPRRDEAGRLALASTVTGGELTSADLRLTGLAGKVALTRTPAAGGNRLEGTGTVTAGGSAFRGSPLGPADLRFELGGHNGTAVLAAAPFGGRLAATFGFDPTAPAKGGSFTATATALDASRLGALFGDHSPWRLAGGTLQANAAGSYGLQAGLTGELDLQGKGLTVAGAGGKQALAGAGLRLRAGLHGADLTLRECTLTTAGGLRLQGEGELTRFAGPERQGHFRYAVGTTSLAPVLDDFANVMPRMLQEATASGSFALRGTATVHGRSVVTDGELTLVDGGLDVPGSRLSIGGVDGRIPFSLDSSGTAVMARPDMLTFSRDNYPLLLERMTQAVQGGRGLTVGRLRFGALEADGARLAFRAGEGVTELTSLAIPFYGGTLLGRGRLQFRNGPRYGADFLIADLSLREFCNAFVATRGYLSGQLEGVVSLRGEGGGIAGLKGFAELWARSSKGEKMLVSREFLQKLAGKKLKGFLFGDDRPYDRAEITTYLDNGYLTFAVLDISHTNIFGVRDLSVSVAPVSNRIAFDHLLTAIKEAAARGKAVRSGEKPAEAAPQTEFKWEE